MSTLPCLPAEVILGVDTHRDTHAAVLVDLLGRFVAGRTFPTSRRGVRALIRWAQLLGTIRRAGVEGTGSYGAGLTRALLLERIEVIEVTRAARVGRRHLGKNDTRDAEAAARSVLSGQATAIPKGRDGIVESIRVLRNARASAVKARTQAIIHLKNLVVTAPDELRESLRGLTNRKMIDRCARMRCTHRLDAIGATRTALRTLARRHKILNEENRRARRHAQRARRPRRATPPQATLDRPRDRRPPPAGRRRQPEPDPQRLRARRSLRRLPRRSVQREDQPTPPQPRR